MIRLILNNAVLEYIINVIAERIILRLMCMHLRNSLVDPFYMYFFFFFSVSFI